MVRRPACFYLFYKCNHLFTNKVNVSPRSEGLPAEALLSASPARNSVRSYKSSIDSERWDLCKRYSRCRLKLEIQGHSYPRYHLCK